MEVRKLVHTPEGVRDIYGEEYAKKIAMEEKLHHVLNSYGYRDIQTPSFEYFDVFSNEIGTTPSKDLYKFFDKEGNTLVLRPDFTPSIARCAAKYFLEEANPLRFCYSGNAFSNTLELQGKLKEVTQMGSELIGDDSVEADAEQIALVIDTLLQAGLKKFQISIGQVEYYKGICEEAGLSDEMEMELRSFISQKNYFGAEDFLIQKEIPEEFRGILLKSAELFGGAEILKEAGESVHNKRSIQAVDRLQSIYQALCTYGVEKYVSFDLGMLSKYHYYTGVIFKAYTYGVGDAIVTGGRYNKLLGHFGKEKPAIGFMIIIDSLMEALTRQGIMTEAGDPVEKVFYTKENFCETVQMVKKMRADGKNVELLPEGR